MQVEFERLNIFLKNDKFSKGTKLGVTTRAIAILRIMYLQCIFLYFLAESIKKNLEDMMVALLQVGAEGSEKMAELIKKHSGPFQMQVIFYNPHFSP